MGEVCDSAASFLRPLVNCGRATTQGEPVNEGDLLDRVEGFGNVVLKRRLVEEFGTALHWGLAQ
ncbi:MAG TPA: hypothetical protein VF808_10035 [Ktedonobacterales bacterium]